MTMLTPETTCYFRRYGFCERQIVSPPNPDLGIVVVIPCFNEPDLIGGLESLRGCKPPTRSAKVIVVINSSADCPAEVRLQNEATRKLTAEWMDQQDERRCAWHLLSFPDLPPKRAGVGLARKIGMDEALRRFDRAGATDGIIVGYDADCRCEDNYLTAIEQFFQANPVSPGCSIYFEHPLIGPLPAMAYRGVAAYELHLRYYKQALRHAGHPHAHHTLGSCMAVRADAYRKQGGMNKRKAGEDFYFLNKIIPLGGFGDLTGTAVYPSPRPSDRVPFGTGKAIRAFLDANELNTYPFQAFLDLKQLIECLPALYKLGGRFAGENDVSSPGPLRTFLKDQEFAAVMKEIHGNTASEDAFRRRFFRWFDGFMAMKFVHHARDVIYGP